MAMGTEPPPTTTASPSKPGAEWIWFLAYGGAQVLVGLLAMSASVIATFATVIFIGFFLLIGGAAQVVTAVSARGKGFWPHLIAGILYAIMGLFMIEHPVEAAVGLTLMLACAFLVGGLVRILMATSDRFPGWGLVLGNGIITLILGIMLWRRWPEDSLRIIGLFVGIDMVLSGLTWVMFAVALRGTART